MAATPSFNIVIPQAADFEEVFFKKNTDGSAIDLSGYTGESKIRKFPQSPTSESFTVGIVSTTGQITIGMTAPITALLNSGRHYYDINLTSPAGTISRFMEGMAMVTPGVTTS